jgi:hypothetical protein
MQSGFNVGRAIRAVLFVALLAGTFGGLQAAPLTYGCAGSPSSICNGNEYAVWLVSTVGTTSILELDIKVGNAYTGNKWTDKVVAVELKDFTSNPVSAAALIQAPGVLGDWTLLSNELSAKACDGGSPGTPNMCAEASSYATAAAFTVGDILKWRFQYDSPNAVGTTAHLKYLYISGAPPPGGDYNRVKVGDLGSWDIAIQRPDPPSSDEPTPEPATFATIGAGLLALGLRYRKAKS